MPIVIEGVDEEQLERQRSFLRSRIEFHLPPGEASPMKLACAATLMQDVASLSLLLEDVATARHFLRQAGQTFLRAGFSSGVALVMLAGLGETQEIAVATIRFPKSTGESSTGGTPPLSAGSAFRQVLSQHQVDWLGGPDQGKIRLTREEEVHQPALDGYRVGDTGLTFATYRAAAAALQSADATMAILADRTDGLPRVAETAVGLLAASRAENLRAALTDSYHWHLFARPSAFLDYDAMILMCVGLKSGHSPDRLQAAFPSVDPMLRAPLLAAQLLLPVVRQRGRPDFGGFSMGN